VEEKGERLGWALSQLLGQALAAPEQPQNSSCGGAASLTTAQSGTAARTQQSPVQRDGPCDRPRSPGAGGDGGGAPARQPDPSAPGPSWFRPPAVPSQPPVWFGPPPPATERGTVHQRLGPQQSQAAPARASPAPDKRKNKPGKVARNAKRLAIATGAPPRPRGGRGRGRVRKPGHPAPAARGEGGRGRGAAGRGAGQPPPPKRGQPGRSSPHPRVGSGPARAAGHSPAPATATAASSSAQPAAASPVTTWRSAQGKGVGKNTVPAKRGHLPKPTQSVRPAAAGRSKRPVAFSFF